MPRQGLAEQVDVLPATGGAVEDLVDPEIEEREDRVVNRDERVFASAPQGRNPNPTFAGKRLAVSITGWA